MSSDDEDEEPTPQPKSQTPKPVKETLIPKTYKPKIPYPQRLRKEKMEAHNNHKLEQISPTFVGDESFALLQNKVPLKLGDRESFLIPCNFNKAFSCDALADLDFIILEIEEDSKVPLILGRPFLHITDAVNRVKQKQLNLEVGTERMSFYIDSAMKHSYSNDDTCFSIEVIDEILKEDFDALLDEEPPTDLELKPLPDNLEYAFLEEPSFLL
ncbi:hypothetical protein Tco_1465252 [Tanacetum coccineum]